MQEQRRQLKRLILYGVFIWHMTSFGCERTVVTAAAQTQGVGGEA